MSDIDRLIDAIRLVGGVLIALQFLTIVVVLAAEFRSKHRVEHTFYVNTSADPKQIINEIRSGGDAE